MTIIKLEEQRTILIDAVRVAGQTTLVHVNIMNTRPVRRAKDISSSLLVDGIRDDWVQVGQNTSVGAIVALGENLSLLNVHQTLCANEVQALEGSNLVTTDVAVVTAVVVVAVVVAFSLVVGAAGARRGGKMEAELQAGELLGDGVGEATVEPVHKASVLVSRLDVDSGFKTLAGGGIIREVEVDVGGLGVLLCSLSFVAGGDASPDTVVGDSHFDCEEW